MIFTSKEDKLFIEFPVKKEYGDAYLHGKNSIWNDNSMTKININNIKEIIREPNGINAIVIIFVTGKSYTLYHNYENVLEMFKNWIINDYGSKYYSRVQILTKSSFCLLKDSVSDKIYDAITYGFDAPIPFTRMTLNYNHRLVPEIRDVIFNKDRGLTIVVWKDNTKTFIKKHEEDSNDNFDPLKSLALAISKKALGNRYRYIDELMTEIVNSNWMESKEENKNENV